MNRHDTLTYLFAERDLLNERIRTVEEVIEAYEDLSEVRARLANLPAGTPDEELAPFVGSYLAAIDTACEASFEADAAYHGIRYASFVGARTLAGRANTPQELVASTTGYEAIFEKGGFGCSDGLGYPTQYRARFDRNMALVSVVQTNGLKAGQTIYQAGA